MAAPGNAITTAVLPRFLILGEDEDLLWDMATDTEPEHGCLSIYDTADQHTVAFTPRRNGLPARGAARIQTQPHHPPRS